MGAAQEVIALKGYTNWGIGLTVASLFKAIVHNNRSIFPISTIVKGMHGISDEVFVSVPCQLGSSGIQRRIEMNLTEDEHQLFLKSVEVVWSVAKDVNLS